MLSSTPTLGDSAPCAFAHAAWEASSETRKATSSSAFARFAAFAEISSPSTGPTTALGTPSAMAGNSKKS